jgi:hypothetical protein
LKFSDNRTAGSAGKFDEDDVRVALLPTHIVDGLAFAVTMGDGITDIPKLCWLLHPFAVKV